MNDFAMHMILCVCVCVKYSPLGKFTLETKLTTQVCFGSLQRNTLKQFKEIDQSKM